MPLGVVSWVFRSEQDINKTKGWQFVAGTDWVWCHSHRRKEVNPVIAKQRTSSLVWGIWLSDSDRTWHTSRLMELLFGDDRLIYSQCARTDSQLEIDISSIFRSSTITMFCRCLYSAQCRQTGKSRGQRHRETLTNTARLVWGFGFTM